MREKSYVVTNPHLSPFWVEWFVLWLKYLHTNERLAAICHHHMDRLEGMGA